MDQEQLSQLLDKYKQGKLGQQDIALLETWYIQESASEKPKLTEGEVEAISARIRLGLPITVRKPHRVRLWHYVSAAASITLIVAGAYLYNGFDGRQNLKADAIAAHISAGSQTATLTLANGKTIRLADVSNGELAKEAGVVITKTADGRVVYMVSDLGRDHSNTTNTLSTARGETYTIVLPDGTQVSLNAESSLTYPVSFANKTYRTVSLKGEGYFEVSKDKKHPFLVKTDKQDVQVLGTHFNINAYGNEADTKTTLLEGSVKVSAGGSMKTLRPGEQAVNDGSGIDVGAADVDATVAWQKGEFVFRDEPLGSIMRKVERWYDVKVVYEGVDQDLPFWGAVSRFEHISEILEKLELTGDVHFVIEGKKIIVRK